MEIRIGFGMGKSEFIGDGTIEEEDTKEHTYRTHLVVEIEMIKWERTKGGRENGRNIEKMAREEVPEGVRNWVSFPRIWAEIETQVAVAGALNPCTLFFIFIRSTTAKNFYPVFHQYSTMVCIL